MRLSELVMSLASLLIWMSARLAAAEVTSRLCRRSQESKKTRKGRELKVESRSHVTMRQIASRRIALVMNNNRALIQNGHFNCPVKEKRQFKPYILFFKIWTSPTDYFNRSFSIPHVLRGLILNDIKYLTLNIARVWIMSAESLLFYSPLSLTNNHN